MKIEEDEIDEIIRKETKIKNNFSEKILQKKIKTMSPNLLIVKLHFLKKDCCIQEKDLKKCKQTQCLFEKTPQHPQIDLKDQAKNEVFFVKNKNLLSIKVRW